MNSLNITYYECVCIFALAIRHAVEIFCAILYCHLWSVWLYHIFPHYLMNGTIFG